MSPRVAKTLRAVTISAFVVVLALLAFRIVRVLNPPDPLSVGEPAAGELQVAEAINGPETGPVVVRGHVFNDPGGQGLRLCHGKQNTTPPTCLGPYLDLDGVNDGSFALRRASAKGLEVRWVDESMALRGTVYDGTRLQVSQVLR